MIRRLPAFFAFAFLGLTLVFGFPAAASAAAPDVVTFPSTATGSSTALVWGQVNPEGETTTWAVEWDLESADWCTSGGTTGSPAHTTAATPLGFTDPHFHDVSLTLTGLSRSSTYCARVVATDADGKGVSSVQTWVQNSPEVQTTNAFPSSATSGTVEGKINPLGESNTTYWLAYATADSGWCNDGGIGNSGATSANHDLGFSDSTFHNVSITLDGLTTGTAYCARFEAVSDGGYESGSPLVTFTVNAPSVEIFDAISTGNSTATVRGAINAAGVATTYEVKYDLASSAWCTSDGSSGSPANTTDPAAFPFTDETLHNQFVDLTGLTVGLDYCAQLIASNSNGVAASGQTTWTQGHKPGTTTFDSFSTGGTTATVEGLVDPAGETTTYQVQYDLDSSAWCTSGGTSGSPANTTSATSGGLDINGGLQYVAVDLSGLTETHDYCAQLIATNANGEADGGQVTWRQGTPTAETFDGFDTGNTTATIEGDVNPAGKSTTYQVQYDLASSDWCASNGASGSPAYTTAATSLGSTDGAFHNVSVGLSGLAGGESYCGQLIASNSTGGSEGGLVGWDQPPSFTLTVSVHGSGTVTSSPAGINCSSTCSSTFAAGTQVTLTATPAASAPLSWTGCSSIGPTSFLICHVTMNSDVSVGVTFHTPPPPPNGPVAVQLAGTGSGTVTSSPAGIDCGSTCSGEFSTASQVTLTATAAPGSTFEGWSYGPCSTSAPCSVQPLLTGTVTVTATFNKNPTPPKPVQCVVPKLKGKKLPAAKTALRKHHCGVGKITKVKSTLRNKGRVIGEKPKPGRHLRKGAKIALKIGK